jgi:hypothetical protein
LGKCDAQGILTVFVTPRIFDPGNWLKVPNTLHRTLVPWTFVRLAPTMRHS